MVQEAAGTRTACCWAGGAGMTLTADGGYRPFNEADKPEGLPSVTWE